MASSSFCPKSGKEANEMADKKQKKADASKTENKK